MYVMLHFEGYQRGSVIHFLTYLNSGQLNTLKSLVTSFGLFMCVLSTHQEPCNQVHIVYDYPCQKYTTNKLIA